MIAGKADLLAEALDVTGLGRALRGVGVARGLVIFNYHRIGDPLESPLDRGTFSATADVFADQVQWLKEHSDIIGVEDLESALSDGNACCSMITFDDGYRDNYELAFPILQAAGVPGTFFITSGFLDNHQPAWWDEIAWMVRHSPRPDELAATRWWTAPISLSGTDREIAIRKLLAIYKQLPLEQTEAFLDDVAEVAGSGRYLTVAEDGVWMTWDMVREMNRRGMSIGGHTVSHPVLARCPLKRQAIEIEGCKARIETELGEAITAFSYPVGQPDSFDRGTQECLRRAGFQWGFSFYGGCVRSEPFNRFDLPRMGIAHGLSASRFRALRSWPQLFARH